MTGCTHDRELLKGMTVVLDLARLLEGRHPFQAAAERLEEAGEKLGP